MKYQFVCMSDDRCPLQGEVQEIEMPMSEYTADGHYCPRCGGKLHRTVESMVCGYVAKCDGFFGKTGQY